MSEGCTERLNWHVRGIRHAQSQLHSGHSGSFTGHRGRPANRDHSRPRGDGRGLCLRLRDKTSQGQVPTVALQTDYDVGSSDELTFTHNSGETVDTQYLYVRVRGASCSGTDDPNGEHDADTDLHVGDTFSAGRTITLEGGGGSGALCPNHLDLTGATVTVSWRTGTGTSSTIATWDGPS